MNVEDETVLASTHCRHRATELKEFLTKIDKNVSDHLDVPKYARSRFFKAREDGDDGGRRQLGRNQTLRDLRDDAQRAVTVDEQLRQR